MTPLDDELRDLMSSRAGAVVPPTDPLAGIEERAGRLRRARRARAVAGAALAVALVAVGVPAALGAARPDAGGSTLATVPDPAPSSRPSPSPSAPTSSPEPGVTARPGPVATLFRPGGALDWPMSAFVPQVDAAVARWSAAHPGTGPVLGGVLGTLPVPDGSTARVLQLWRADVAPQVVTTTTALPGQLLRDEPAADLPGPVVRAVLPGGATPYVLVLGGPDVVRVDYAADGARFVPAGGGRFAVVPRTGPTGGSPDLVRVLDAQQRVTALPADPGGPTDREPSGLLSSWPQRGDLAAGPDQAEAAAAFGAALGHPDRPAGLRVLFAGSDDTGRRFLLGQAWDPAASSPVAHTVAYTTGGTGGPEVFLGPPTPAAPPVLATVLCCGTGTTVDTLVVVPQPGTGQVLYASTGSASFRPVGAGQDALDGVVLVDRDPRASTDRLRLLDGDGRETATVDVPALLCGARGCG